MTASAPGQRRKDQEGRRLPYLIARRAGADLTSTFVCVHEPFDKQPRVASVGVVRCEPGASAWPVVVKLAVDGQTWWVGSKCEDGPWRDLPADAPAFNPGRLTATAR